MCMNANVQSPARTSQENARASVCGVLVSVWVVVYMQVCVCMYASKCVSSACMCMCILFMSICMYEC